MGGLANTIARPDALVAAPSGDARLALLLVATLWAALLLMAGAWLWIDAAARWPVAATPCRVAGLTSAGAGQLVFMCVVADRLFPHAPRLLVRVVEGVFGLAVLAGAAWIAVVGVELVLGVA